MLTGTRLRLLIAGLGLALTGIAPVTTYAQDKKPEPKPPEKAGAKPEDKKPEVKKPTGYELPIMPAEKIEFTTDQGTWMSLDLSPGGKKIVFDLLGDLYTLPVEGGEAKRIVGDLSFESQPKWSPDGKQIVFISDRSGAENLWLCDPDGGNLKALTKGRNQLFLSPVWSPDGQYVLASRSGTGIGPYSVWMYHKDGGSGIPVIGSDSGHSGGNNMGVAASPNGRYLYYASRNGAFGYNVTFPIWQIQRLDRETGDTSPITNAQGSAMRPVLSPDGKKLVYVSRFENKTGLRVRDLDTNEERWLLYPVTRDDQESRATRDTFPGYCFLPDGKSLLVTIGGKMQRVELANGKTTNIPFSAKVESEIGPRVYAQNRVDDSPTVRARLIRWPALSPDGKVLVFSALNKLWVMDYPKGTPHRLTDSSVGEFMPSWSPNGKYIAYVTWSTDGGAIYRAAVDGKTPPQRLTSRSAYYISPVYSPDGSKIVYLTGATNDQLFADLHGHPPAGSPEEEALHQGEAEITGPGGAGSGLDLRWIPDWGGASTLIGSANGAYDPHFSSDPNRVYYNSSEGLSSIRLDGYDRRVHLKVSSVGDMRVSPDGQRAFVDVQNRHYIVSIPKIGKDPVTLTIGADGTSSIPVKKMSADGGDYLYWTADGKAVTWLWGGKFYRQDVSTDKPDAADLVVEAPRARPSGTIVLSGAKIVTMKGDEVLRRGDIVIKDNRITAVGPKGKVTIPKDATVLDVTGKTIIPGYVDVHSHMWPPHGVHQTQVWQYCANLAFGVTTTRDPQSATEDVFDYTDLVETGDILGPRIYTTGPGVFSGVGIDSQDAARKYLKKYKDWYHTTTLKEYMTGDRMTRQWVSVACKELGITSTTEGALDMKLDLTQMADGFSGSEHALPIQPLYKDVAQFIARTHTFYTPTLLVSYGAPWGENYYFENTNVNSNTKLRRFVPRELLDGMVKRRKQWFLPEEYGFTGIAQGCADVVHAGGRVCLGSHGQLQGLGAHWEIWSMQSGGLTPYETLRCATIFGAEAIGLQQDLGSLEVGKLADLQILDKDPTADIHNTLDIHYVMKNGVLYEGETLDEVWPKEKKLGKMYWQGGEPPQYTVPQ